MKEPITLSHPVPQVVAFTILGNFPYQHDMEDDSPSGDSFPESSSTITETDEIHPSWSYKRSSTSESSDEYWGQHISQRSKKYCLSCGTKKSPRWHTSRFLCVRPHESICNACAIRIKKYHSICSFCHYALNKQQQTTGFCPRCKRSFSNLIKEDTFKLSV